MRRERTSKVTRNVAIRCAAFSVPQYDLSENLITDKDPGFMDLENGNFQLKADAEIFRKIPGFKALPVEYMGLQIKTTSNLQDKVSLAK
jgi:hypothetical protein